MSMLYAEIILDYYKNPRNYGELKDAQIKGRESNPLCGDIIEIQIKLENNIAKEVRFNGKGCAISQASASMLTEILHGKTLEEIKNINKNDILSLLNMEISPVRLDCALLPLNALSIGLNNFEHRK